ncbi:hypothetical protein MKEN_00806100 [Mycena kentingensis (nom. inval.)]|nr:hypothetical protein MKEN_00806100 [Mycena kentingensis (nom. inval.)]
MSAQTKGRRTPSARPSVSPFTAATLLQFVEFLGRENIDGSVTVALRRDHKSLLKILERGISAITMKNTPTVHSLIYQVANCAYLCYFWRKLKRITKLLGQPGADAKASLALGHHVGFTPEGFDITRTTLLNYVDNLHTTCSSLFADSSSLLEDYIARGKRLTRLAHATQDQGNRDVARCIKYGKHASEALIAFNVKAKVKAYRRIQGLDAPTLADTVALFASILPPPGEYPLQLDPAFVDEVSQVMNLLRSST